MQPVLQHPWNLTLDQARHLQTELAARVIRQDRMGPVQLIAGTDVAYARHSNTLAAAVVLLDAATLQVIEIATAVDTARFAYLPGLFSFRELPPLMQAMAKLRHQPDLIVCDGQGIAHPRRFGLACHLGVLYDIPTIGCGKTRLLGNADSPGNSKGDYSLLRDEDEVIGAVLRTRDNVKPVYVSIGHRISLSTACDWILKLTPRYRLTETTRQADAAVKKALAELA